MIKKDWPIIIFLLATLVLAFYVYPMMPEKVPMHWNARGEIDRYSGRFFGTFGLPLINIGLYFLFYLVPVIDPKKKNIYRSWGVYNIVRYFVHGMFVVIYLMVIAVVFGYNVDVGLITQLIISLMFVFLGNSIGKIKYNYTFGIRLPWTLADERVWKKTHRFGGRLMVMCGILGCLNAFVNKTFAYQVFMTLIIGCFVVIGMYSYLHYRKLNPEE